MNWMSIDQLGFYCADRKPTGTDAFRKITGWEGWLAPAPYQDELMILLPSKQAGASHPSRPVIQRKGLFAAKVLVAVLALCFISLCATPANAQQTVDQILTLVNDDIITR